MFITLFSNQSGICIYDLYLLHNNNNSNVLANDRTQMEEAKPGNLPNYTGDPGDCTPLRPERLDRRVTWGSDIV